MKAFLLLLLAAALALAADEAPAHPQVFTHRITGLFAPDREADLRHALEEVPGVELLSLDFEHAEGRFRYDPKVVFKGTKLEDLDKAFNQKLGTASNHTFGIQPLFATPHDQLTRVEIPIVLLDCRACCLGAYEILAKLDGVAQATASPHEVTALIDPAKTNRAALIEMLKKRQVKVKLPEAEPAKAP